MERHRYPDNWKRIATEKKESVGWVCEVCGKQCRKPGERFDTHKRTLTVAHLDHTPENCDPDNLCAMCAPCHLRYDAQQHAETRKRRKEGKQKMTELKPCPFCGSTVKFEEREFDDFAGNFFTNTMSMIECKKCGISMKRYPKKGYGTTDEQKQDLIDSWNRRDGK